MTMSEISRRKLAVDESRIWNMDMDNKKRISDMIGYLFNKLHVVNKLNITGSSKNLKSMSLAEKNRYLRLYSKYFHRTSTEIDVFYSCFNRTETVLYHALDSILVICTKILSRQER